MKQFNIAIARDASKIVLTYKKRNPSSATGDYFDNTSITAASIKVVNTETDATILAATAMSYSSVIRGWRYVWSYGANLDGITAITVEVTPTRAVGVSATLTPIDSEEFEVADTLQRIDEAASAAPSLTADAVWDEATGGHSTAGTFGKLAQDTKTAVDSLQTDFNSFEAVNQVEHDATQSAISTIGAVARTQLIGPTTFTIPDSGSTTFVLDWVGKDVDASPTILDDPDSNIVDITVTDQTGGSPTGVTLGGSPVGRATRNSLGRYQLEVTVDDTAVDGTQLRFAAASTEDGAADVALWTMTLGDFDQLDDIQSQVNAIRTTDVPALQADLDSILADTDLIKGTGFDSSTDSLAALQAEHDATQALLTHGTFGLAALKTLLDAEAASLSALHTKVGANTDAAGTTTLFARLRQIVETYLADPANGLAALDASLDDVLARLGLTADTGGTSTAGTAMAKLNAILEAEQSSSLSIIPDA
jgi:hypothetical protein